MGRWDVLSNIICKIVFMKKCDQIDVTYILEASGKVIFYVALKDSIKQQMIGDDGDWK